MTKEQFVERCRAMHEARYAVLQVPSNEDTIEAWRRFHKIVLETAKDMTRMGWNASEYFSAYAILEDIMPEKQLSGATHGDDEVATGLRWCYFVLGYEFFRPDEDMA